MNNENVDIKVGDLLISRKHDLNTFKNHVCLILEIDETIRGYCMKSLDTKQGQVSVDSEFVFKKSDWKKLR